MPELGRVRPTLAPNRQSVAGLWPTWANFGRCWQTSSGLLSILVKLRPSLVKVGRNLAANLGPKSGQHRLTLATFWPKVAAMHWPPSIRRQVLANFYPTWPKFDNIWRNVARIWPTSAKFGPSEPERGRSLPNLSQLRPISADFGQARGRSASRAAHQRCNGRTTVKAERV